MIVGIDVGSETHYARAFDRRNYEYTKKLLEFSNTETKFVVSNARGIYKTQGPDCQMVCYLLF